MLIDIKVPSAGESITQVELARWLAEDGAFIEKDQEIAEIDSDKATLTITAEDSGRLIISVAEGSSTRPGQVIGQIDTKAAKPSDSTDATPSSTPEEKAPIPKAIPATATQTTQEPQAPSYPEQLTFSPQANKLLEELGIDKPGIQSRPDGKRITRQDILEAIAIQHHKNQAGVTPTPAAPMPARDVSRIEERKKMSTLRRKVAERLVAVKNETAMLTTFNEVDMSAILDLRKKYQKAFQEKHGIKLGLMSFFAKAVTAAIPYFPQVNGRIDQDTIIFPNYADLGIAVSTPKGLMVPVIRNAEQLSLPALELAIAALAQKARENKISIEELTGGTISITNGGVFGSMLSTPIINPPQSAILGMHNIVERPVAINGRVEIRPIMYLALSYDHRIVDGRESVGFLKKVKEMIEQPASLLMGGKDPGTELLEL